ncbi:MAG: hypothetical protein ABI286_12295 [Edaphobacter sp.]
MLRVGLVAAVESPTMKRVGSEGLSVAEGPVEQVPIVDMATVEADRLEALGQEKAALLFPIDHTPTSVEEAERNAESVPIALRTPTPH